jgi:hypothetical protein
LENDPLRANILYSAVITPTGSRQHQLWALHPLYHLLRTWLILLYGDIEKRFFHNSGPFLPNYKASYPRRQ